MKPLIAEPQTFFKAPLSTPQPGSIGYTGTWWTMKPIVNKDKCTGCQLCWLYCPEDTIIVLDDGKVDIDYDYCKGCGICSSVCPFKAINMIPEG